MYTINFSNLFILSLLVITGFSCTTVTQEKSTIQQGSFKKQIEKVTSSSNRSTSEEPPDLKKPGAFTFAVHKNFKVSMSPDSSIVVDAYIPKTTTESPLLILAHGNNSAKEAHSGQAEHLASWGIHVVVVQLEKRDQWIRNGEKIRKLSELFFAYPALISNKIDRTKIILAGHSFGGSAVILATAQRAPIAGVILLDPAVVSKEVKKVLDKVRTPVMLIGADPNVYRSRQRSAFFKGVKGEAGEISIKGATHDDAQFPSMYSLHAFGIDPFTSTPQRLMFLKAITATVFSVSAGGNLNFAWSNLASDLKQGLLINPLRRSPVGF